MPVLWGTLATDSAEQASRGGLPGARNAQVSQAFSGGAAGDYAINGTRPGTPTSRRSSTAVEGRTSAGCNKISRAAISRHSWATAEALGAVGLSPDYRVLSSSDDARSASSRRARGVISSRWAIFPPPSLVSQGSHHRPPHHGQKWIFHSAAINPLSDVPTLPPASPRMRLDGPVGRIVPDDA